MTTAGPQDPNAKRETLARAGRTTPTVDSHLILTGAGENLPNGLPAAIGSWTEADAAGTDIVLGGEGTIDFDTPGLYALRLAASVIIADSHAGKIAGELHVITGAFLGNFNGGERASDYNLGDAWAYSASWLIRLVDPTGVLTVRITSIAGGAASVLDIAELDIFRLA